FRDAVIVAGGETWRGDVELHVHSRDFLRHGHHRDSAYRNLILHVVFWDDAEPLLVDGRRVPVVALGPWVGQRAQELEGWLLGTARFQEPCHSAVARLGEETVGCLLEEMGWRRYWAKVEDYRKAEEQGLYRALLEALGYGGGREAFRALSESLPWRRARELLQGGWRPLYEEAWALLEGGPIPYGLRPANYPARRLAGGAVLLSHLAPQGLGQAFRGLVGQATSPRQLLAALMVRGPDPLARGRATIALIGPGRALELVVNVVIPFVAARGGEALALRSQELYRRLPAPPSYGITRHLERALRAATGRPLARGALGRQGLLELFNRYCRVGLCGGCPLS
ncbi:MAG TPA: DUF2851 family protein, partial [Dehalococcoidia bacterium]|nr:DUF2851 family protein [Dehalococcoidia bacterium]